MTSRRSYLFTRTAAQPLNRLSDWRRLRVAMGGSMHLTAKQPEPGLRKPE
jgi:hypothetical protein